MRILMTLIAVITMAVGSASARDISVATWNLGWHIDKATVGDWIAACDATYVQDPTTNLWVRSTAANSVSGWDIRNTFAIDGWDSTRLPVCNVYKERNGDVVPVTEVAYAKRAERIAAYIEHSLQVDVIAFQEVSSKAAVEEVLPNSGSDFEICTYEGFKVQRLAIAWRKTIGRQIDCHEYEPLGLTAAADQTPFAKQPRPGLQLDLEIDGSRVQVLTVHLKSSCVSPFENPGLAGDGDNCPILQKQIAHLESWVEQATSDQVKTIILGDFNRNFWHELKDATQVRTDGSAPDGILGAGVKVNSLFEEVFDREPAPTYFVLLPEECAVNDLVKEIANLVCATSEQRPLLRSETEFLGTADYLGCRNPVGLDHILVGPGITASAPARHLPLGPLGGTLPKKPPEHPDPLLAIADHCPLTATLGL